jgi:hypothetical protein
MKPIFDAFWRAAAYCLHPRVIALSLLPLLIMVGVAWVLSYFFWDQSIAAVNERLLSGDWLRRTLDWLQGMGFGGLKAVIAPLILVMLVTPVVVVSSLLMVAFLMTPAMVSLVAERRFAQLERKVGAGVLASVAWSLGTTSVALLVLLASIPLWVIPPLILVVPPLVWGWLTYRVLAFDALALHASTAERREIFKTQRMQLFGMGVVCGYLGAAPTLIWAGGVLTVFLAPVFLAFAIWLYTLVFAFSSLWFAHFCLNALDEMRKPIPSQNMPTAAVNINEFAIKNVANDIPVNDLPVNDIPVIELKHDPKPQS